MIPKKPAPGLIRGGNRFPACAKPWHGPWLWIDASAGEGRSEKITHKEEMSGSTISSEGLDARRRRLLFRAWHRGMREVDLITGRFADAHIASLSEAEVEAFERLMDVPEPELLAWIMGSAPTPPDHDTPLFRRICAFRVGTA